MKVRKADELQGEEWVWNDLDPFLNISPFRLAAYALEKA